MPFVKVDCALRKNVRLQRISRSAEVVYRRSQELAQELADDGARVGCLEHPQLGRYSLSEIALQIYLPEKEVAAALKELVGAGLWEQADDGCVWLPRFAEKTKPIDSTAAERQQRLRDRRRNAALGNGVVSQPRNGVTARDITGGVTGDVTPQNREARSKKDTPLSPQGGEGRSDGAPPLSEPFGLAAWFLGLALETGLVDSAGLEREERIRADLKAAKALLVHGVEECQRRARRFVAALRAGKLDRCAPTLRSLKVAWEYGLVARDPAPERRPGVRPGSLDDLAVTVMPQ